MLRISQPKLSVSLSFPRYMFACKCCEYVHLYTKPDRWKIIFSLLDLDVESENMVRESRRK